jgi:hypothetical protein
MKIRPVHLLFFPKLSGFFGFRQGSGMLISKSGVSSFAIRIVAVIVDSIIKL